MLELVDGGGGGVGAGVGEGPTDDAGLGLLHVPARRLLAAMVPSALRSEVALVGRAVGPGGGVILVAVDGLGVAAGGVAVFGVAVVALALGDGLGGELELREKFVESR